MTRALAFDQNGWEDYLYWQTQDRKTLKRINLLIADALRRAAALRRLLRGAGSRRRHQHHVPTRMAEPERDPFAGIGKPEPLKHILSGAWSRRIDETNRLVYYVTDDHIVILQAHDHY